MKKLLLTLITILIISTNCYAINPLDKIAPNDKQLHFMASYIVTDIFQTEYKMEWWQSAIGIYVLSITKEQLDIWFGGKWDNTDIMANMLGYSAYNIIHIDW